MKPVVSVVIPNYNYGRYLDQRIQTVLNQSYQDFELILLDDASTDNSIDILQKYKMISMFLTSLSMKEIQEVLSNNG